MGGHLRFFPGYLHLFPGKIRSYFWPQNAQSAKMPKVVQLHSCGEKPLKKTEISQISIYLFFRGYRIYIYTYIHIVIYIYIAICVSCKFPCWRPQSCWLEHHFCCFIPRFSWGDGSELIGVFCTQMPAETFLCSMGGGDTFWVRGGSFKIFTLTWDGGEREREIERER